jgi:hypothetical protein
VKIKLNKEQIDFLKEIAKDTESEKDVLLFSSDQEFDLNDDLADELRDLCAGYEVDNAQEHKDMSLDAKGKIAYDLVNLLYS